GQVLRLPISHAEGNYFADAETLQRLESEGRVLFRYCDADGEVTGEANPNGSLANIAGITNERGNVLGMMPHPERCCDPLLGGVDGKLIFQSIIESSRSLQPAGRGGKTN
ncbi:MAG: phosphoribosylformylglycinamidine synthase subunit PurQ, partial [Chloroflexi bacterium]|nr:phosphoribosylformylglycinamidine synthase subunit PurQ [Chloroflexota bacterium]